MTLDSPSVQQIRGAQACPTFLVQGVPANGVTLAGVAVPGAQATNQLTGTTYTNTGTLASPVWTAGPIGATGPTGPAGSTGATGPTGATGGSGAIVNITSSTPTNITTGQAGSTFYLNSLLGATLTLPSATGSGRWYNFYVGQVPFSAGQPYVMEGNASLFAGQVLACKTDQSGIVAYLTSVGGGATCALNGTTTGGQIGDWLTMQDVASGVYSITGVLAYTTSSATPFGS